MEVGRNLIVTKKSLQRKLLWWLCPQSLFDRGDLGLQDADILGIPGNRESFLWSYWSSWIMASAISSYSSVCADLSIAPHLLARKEVWRKDHMLQECGQCLAHIVVWEYKVKHIQLRDPGISDSFPVLWFQRPRPSQNQPPVVTKN